MRSFHTSFGSPIDTQTSVWMKSTSLTAFFGSSVMVSVAPYFFSSSRAMATNSSAGHSFFGPQMRTSMPIRQPTIISEWPMLLRVSPRKAYLICEIGLSLCSRIVITSASICVGWYSSVRPLNTGTPAYLASVSTPVWLAPRYSSASNMRPSTRAVSLNDSLWPICEPAGSR